MYTSYRMEDCIEILCSSLRERPTNILNFEKENMLPLTKES